MNSGALTTSVDHQPVFGAPCHFGDAANRYIVNLGRIVMMTTTILHMVTRSFVVELAVPSVRFDANVFIPLLEELP
jgi:hypothetical protein